MELEIIRAIQSHQLFLDILFEGFTLLREALFK